MRASVKGKEGGEWDTASWEVHSVFYWMMMVLFGCGRRSGGGRVELDWMGDRGEECCDDSIFVG